MNVILLLAFLAIIKTAAVALECDSTFFACSLERQITVTFVLWPELSVLNLISVFPETFEMTGVNGAIRVLVRWIHLPF